MASIASALDSWFVICDRAVSGGYVVAMALVCALQYLYYLHSSRGSAALKRQLREQINEVQNDLRAVSRDRTLTSFENQILREFSEELDLDRTLDQLVRRLVAETSNGFAGYVSLSDSPPRMLHARGLAEKARDGLLIDEALIKRVAEEGITVLEKKDLQGSQLLDSLSAGDQSRFERLFLARLGDRDQVVGVVVTTSLIPAGIPLDEQVDLARRLIQSLGGIVKRTKELQDRDLQLQSINEIMELRTVTDQKHASPLNMIDAFVDRLREMAGADRAVLYLITPEERSNYKPLCRCGVTLAAAGAKKYADFEAILAETVVAHTEPEALGAADLARLGITSMIGAALVAPVISPNGIAGALCLTCAANRPLVIKPELINWAARYLSQTLLRALHQAVSEWHARQDPLTDLPNRRTFDREFSAALQLAADEGRSCALVMVDIDRFKSINDGHGHPMGDEVLRCVSRLLKELVGRMSSDALAARFGGEEFVILLPGVGADQAVRAAEHLRSAIEMLSIRMHQSQVSVTASMGVALFPEHATNGPDLISAADAALYHAKESGRNRVAAAGKLTAAAPAC